MPYPARAYRIVVASPSDVQDERSAARDVIVMWNSVHSYDMNVVLIPVGWETDSTPALGDNPQEILNRQLLPNSDILLGIFGSRFGTPTGRAESGTLEEIVEFVKQGKPVLLYFSNMPIPRDKADPIQMQQLSEFKNAVQKVGLVRNYDSLLEFRELLSQHLTNAVRELERKEGVRINTLSEQPARGRNRSEIAGDFKRFVRSREGEWKALRRDGTFAFNGAKTIVEQAKRRLVSLRGEALTGEHEELEKRIDSVLALMNQFVGARNSFGGEEQFWELGDHIIDEVKQLVSMVDEVFGTWV